MLYSNSPLIAFIVAMPCFSYFATVATAQQLCHTMSDGTEICPAPDPPFPGSEEENSGGTQSRPPRSFSVDVENKCNKTSTIDVFYVYLDNLTGEWSDVEFEYNIEFEETRMLTDRSGNQMQAMGGHYYIVGRTLIFRRPSGNQYAYLYGEGRGSGPRGEEYQFEIERGVMATFRRESSTKTHVNIICPNIQ